MSPLHLSKVAVGCASLETLKRRQSLRVCDGEVPLVTRFMPKRAEELVGGSLYWIIKHQLVARQTIIGFAPRESDRRTVIRLALFLCPTLVMNLRAGAASHTPVSSLIGFSMAVMAGSEPAELRRRVTSPKGTTEQAIGVLQEARLGEVFDRATAAALARAQELAVG